MKIFFSVGEPSGDLHAANLIRAIRSRRPDAQFTGFGGPRMQAAGAVLLTDLTELAVMWIVRALANLHTFLALVSEADRHFRHRRPDAVVLVDYPGFNWWIAWRAKAHGIPVFYYSPPQVWAWASWRVRKMRRYVDHVLCGLPFEAQWYRERGCHATFIGHPYFDEVRQRELDQALIEPYRAGGQKLLTLLPGSRTQEVHDNLPAFLRTAAKVHEALPDVRFAVAAFKASHAAYARELVRGISLPVDVYVGRTPELIEAATCCLACSGSVSLELLHHARPTVIHYRINRFWNWLQGRLRHTRYITLVNLLADDEPLVPHATHQITAAASADDVLFPEYLTTVDRSADMARQLVGWLADDARRQQREEELIALRERIGHGGASSRAADYILSVIGDRSPVSPRPHFTPGMRVASSAGADAEYAAAAASPDSAR